MLALFLFMLIKREVLEQELQMLTGEAAWPTLVSRCFSEGRWQVRSVLLLGLLLLVVSPGWANEKLYVSSFFDSLVEVYDPAQLEQPPASVAVGVYPNQIVASPAGDAIYVANYATADVSVIDPLTLTVSQTIPLSCAPFSLDVAADGINAYAVCRNTGRVVQVDLSGGGEVGQLAVTFPYDLALHPLGRYAYVTRSFFSRYLDVIDLAEQKTVATVTVGRSPKGVVSSPDGAFVYVANSGSATLSVVDTSSNQTIRTIAVADDPNALAIDKGGDWLYVSHRSENSVSIIDLNSFAVLANLPVGLAPERMAPAADGSRLYVANFNGNSISVVDLVQMAVVATLPSGNGPFDLLLHGGQDVTPPEIRLRTEQAVLWPPNHKLHDVHFEVTLVDNQDPAPQLRLLSVVSSEPCDGERVVEAAKKGRAEPQGCDDIVGADFGSDDVDFQLRAERYANDGNGRVYSVSYEAVDAAGNRVTATFDISVPFNFSP